MSFSFSGRRLVRAVALSAVWLMAWTLFAHSPAWSQQPGSPEPSNQRTPSDDVLPDVSVATPQATPSNPESSDVLFRQKGLNLLTLLGRGGWFMVPLGLLSVLVVALSIERLLALREEKMLPQALIRDLGQLSRQDEGFDPRMAYRACQIYPSAASRVVRTMLLKVGRPQSEVESAVREASEREATRLQSAVSWLTLAAAVAPLIGLLGTVWGMIQAFYDTTQLLPGQDKAEVLAQGIYTALVTTMSGLVIAIPSAVMAHYFDNKIVSWFHRIDELATSLTPMIEQFEGKLRTTADGGTESIPTAAPRRKRERESSPEGEIRDAGRVPR